MASDETEDTRDTTESEAPPPAKSVSASRPPPRSLNDRSLNDRKKKKSKAEVQAELRELSKPQEAEKPPANLNKIYLRGGALVLVVWIIALILRHWAGFAAAGALTVAGLVALVWLQRYMKKTQALGAILKSADTEEGRKAALEKLSTDFKKGDTQAVIASMTRVNSPRLRSSSTWMFW